MEIWQVSPDVVEMTRHAEFFHIRCRDERPPHPLRHFCPGSARWALSKGRMAGAAREVGVHG